MPPILNGRGAMSPMATGMEIGFKPLDELLASMASA
jgi:hypothetical protein